MLAIAATTGSESSARGWPHAGREKTMKRATKNSQKADLLDEYDFSKGIRRKYAKRYAEGTNIVVLAPDVAAVFKNSQSVNEALRAFMKIGRQTSK